MSKYSIIVTLFVLSACVPPHQRALSSSAVKKQPIHTASVAHSVKNPTMKKLLESKSDAFLYLSSKAALNDKNYSLAYSFLEVLTKRSEQLLPQLELARLYLDAGKAAEAEALLAPFLKKNPIKKSNKDHDSNALLYGLYVGALLKQDKNAAAITYLQQLLIKNPTSIAVRVHLIETLIRQKSWHKADVLIQQSLKQKVLPVLLGLQVESALKQGHTKQAMHSIQRWHKLQPNNEKVIILKSNIELQAGHKKKAAQVLQKYIRTHPKAVEVSHHLGQLFIRQKRLLAATHVYEKMLSYGVAKIEIYSTLALLYYQQKKHKQAVNALIEGLRLAPNNDMFHFYLAINQEILGDTDAAERHYKHVSEHYNRYAMSRLRLALIAMNRNEVDHAIAILVETLKKKPAFAAGWEMLSSLYLQQKAYQKLLDKTEPALALKKVSNGLLLNRAVALDHFKRYQEIDATIGQILEQDPDSAEALNFLGYSLAERGIRLDEAEKYVRRALKKKPNNGFYLDSLAWIFYQRGVYGKAIELQQKALKVVNTIDPIMFDHLGDMLWKNGNHSAAITAWGNSLSREKGDKRKDLEKKIRQGL